MNIKFKTNLWITPVLQKSISIKNNLLKKLVISKDPQAKQKNYRNLLSTILKKRKTNCYNHYFESNRKNVKNTWEVINSIVTIKNISADISKSLSVDGTTKSNPMVVSNVFKSIFLQLLIKPNLSLP